MTPNMVLFVFICILLFFFMQISAGPFGEWLLWPRLWPVLSTSAPLHYVCRQHLQCQQSARGRNTVFPDLTCVGLSFTTYCLFTSCFFFFFFTCHSIAIIQMKICHLFVHSYLVCFTNFNAWFQKQSYMTLTHDTIHIPWTGLNTQWQIQKWLLYSLWLTQSTAVRDASTVMVTILCVCCCVSTDKLKPLLLWQKEIITKWTITYWVIS